jgi:hypothetical protein
VLDKLRALALREAKLLFREHRLDPERHLPDLSIELSRAILRATDAIELGLDVVPEPDAALLRTLVLDHLPRVVVETAGPEQVLERLPARYCDGIVASSLAARIVYQEGTKYLASLGDAELAATAIAYLRQERETQKLIAEVLGSDLPHKERMAALLREGGVRTALDLARMEGAPR